MYFLNIPVLYTKLICKSVYQSRLIHHISEKIKNYFRFCKWHQCRLYSQVLQQCGFSVNQELLVAFNSANLNNFNKIQVVVSNNMTFQSYRYWFQYVYNMSPIFYELEVRF